jgi:hypothetical protein
MLLSRRCSVIYAKLTILLDLESGVNLDVCGFLYKAVKPSAVFVALSRIERPVGVDWLPNITGVPQESVAEVS